MPVSQETLDEIALTREEYDLIVARIEREPNGVELGLFGALWSEHCGYKHSKPLLRGFPTTGEAVRVRAGEENAGVVDIGGGLAVVFKIESHNHPSAVEPYQGAATGVGGIVRDILAMGARPIALLNSLRFGPLDSAAQPLPLPGRRCGHLRLRQLHRRAGRGRRDAVCSHLQRQPARQRHVRRPASARSAHARCRGQPRLALPARGLRDRQGRHPRRVRPRLPHVRGGSARCVPPSRLATPSSRRCSSRPASRAAGSGLLDGMQDLGAAGLTSSVDGVRRAGRHRRRDRRRPRPSP